MAESAKVLSDSLSTNESVFSDNQVKVAYGITWLGGKVHESITKEAAKQAGMEYTDKLERGIRWNDAPSDNPEELSYLQLNPFNGDINKPGTMTYRSHKGDLQTLHSMTPVYDTGKVPTNGEVRDKIITQSVELFEQARNTDNQVYLGKLLHTVQDAYVLSHVQRDENDKVKGFQDYNEQDHGAHSSDEMRQTKTVTEVVGIQRQVLQDWQDVPGTKDAVKASADIMKLYNDPNKTSKDLAEYLSDKVYPFENEQTKDLPASTRNRGGHSGPRLPLASSNARRICCPGCAKRPLAGSPGRSDEPSGEVLSQTLSIWQAKSRPPRWRGARGWPASKPHRREGLPALESRGLSHSIGGSCTMGGRKDAPSSMASVAADSPMQPGQE